MRKLFLCVWLLCSGTRFRYDGGTLGAKGGLWIYSSDAKVATKFPTTLFDSKGLLWIALSESPLPSLSPSPYASTYIAELDRIAGSLTWKIPGFFAFLGVSNFVSGIASGSEECILLPSPVLCVPLALVCAGGLRFSCDG